MPYLLGSKSHIPNRLNGARTPPPPQWKEGTRLLCTACPPLPIYNSDGLFLWTPQTLGPTIEEEKSLQSPVVTNPLTQALTSYNEVCAAK